MSQIIKINIQTKDKKASVDKFCIIDYIDRNDKVIFTGYNILEYEELYTLLVLCYNRGIKPQIMTSTDEINKNRAIVNRLVGVLLIDVVDLLERSLFDNEIKEDYYIDLTKD